MNTIRTQVSRFKRKHPEFDRLFGSWYVRYLYEHASAEWFVSHESSCREQFEKHKRDPAWADSYLLASEAITMARMYQASGRNAESLALYEFGMEMSKTHGATWPKPSFGVVKRLQSEIESLSLASPALPGRNDGATGETSDEPST